MLRLPSSQVETKTRHEIEEKKKQLRSVVGDSYRCACAAYRPQLAACSQPPSATKAAAGANESCTPRFLLPCRRPLAPATTPKHAPTMP